MSYIKYTLKNLNKEKILKDLFKVARLKKIKINKDTFSFIVLAKYDKLINEIIVSKNYVILSKEKVGWLNYMKKTILRPAIVIALIFVLCVMFVSNFFIFQYKILGLEMVSNSEVIQVLKDNGYYGVKLKSAINKKDIENLVLKINKVSLVSVIIRGNTLVLNVKEKIYNEEYEDKGQFQPIYSNFDGIITEVSLVSGTALVSVGQTVKVGQELVAPYVIDSSGNKLSVKPFADIKADTFNYTITEVPDEQIIYEDTGKKINSKIIYLCNSPIYNNSKECDFKYYRTEVKAYYLTNNLFLPFKIKKTIIYEQSQKTISNYFEQNKNDIMLECKEKTLKLVNDYDVIKDEYFNLTQNAGINRITYTVIVNKSIC